MGWLETTQLSRFRSVGRGVRVSDGAVIFGPENISIGDNVRIDHGAKLLAGAGEITIGSHVHIACDAILLAGGGITLCDHTCVGLGSQLLGASDSFEGDCLIGPQYDKTLTKVHRAPIVMRRLSVLGSGVIVLPGVELAHGSAVGASSLVLRSTMPWVIYAGRPVRAIRPRDKQAEGMAVAWEERWQRGQI